MRKIAILAIAIAFAALSVVAGPAPNVDGLGVIRHAYFFPQQGNQSLPAGGGSGGAAFPVTVTGGVSGAVPCFTSTTVESAGTLLAANGLVLGGGAGVCPSTSTNFSVSGGQLNIGAVGTAGVLGLVGSTSGTATFTAPAVAGTSTNAITMTNVLAGPVGSSAAPTYAFSAFSNSGFYEFGGGSVALSIGGGINYVFGANYVGQLGTTSGGAYSWTSSTTSGGSAPDTALTRDAAGVVDIGTGAAGSVAGTLQAANYKTSNKVILISSTAPSVATNGCGTTGASIVSNNGTAAFKVNVGTTNSGTCTITMPTATTDWLCFATDITTTSTTVSQTKSVPGGTPATQIVLQNYTDISGTHAWVDSDIIGVTCSGE